MMRESERHSGPPSAHSLGIGSWDHPSSFPLSLSSLVLLLVLGLPLRFREEGESTLLSGTDHLGQPDAK